MTDSHTLLALYVRTGSESVFRELVSRYLDLVYSTAYRLVGGDAESAQDVAQTVFLALAAKAATLPKDVMLGGWLHEHTRFVAGKLVRTERRRQLRERQVAEMKAIEDHSESNLAQVASVLDEAIGQLDAEDRTAILLRFFERKDFRSVGEALGSSEDAARKRVDRAVEKLHVLLKHRGATLSATALGTALAAEAVTAAPAGLAATVATACLAPIVTTAAVLASTKALTMTTLQKAIVTGTVAVLVGAGVYEARKASRLESEFRMLNDRHALLVAQMEQLKSERDETQRQRTDAAADKQGPDVDATELLRLRGEVGLLRRQLADLAAKAQTATNQIQFSVPCLPRAAWSDQGTDKPRNTILTMFWAIGQGDQNRLEQLVSRQKDTQTLDDMTIPKSDWDEIAAVRAGRVVSVHTPTLDTATVEAIVQTVPSQDGTKDVYCYRWFLMKTNDQWLITGPGRM